MAFNTPFPAFKTTGDEKCDLKTYIEHLTDYCIMQNWFDPSKESDAEKWTKPDKAMACLRASLSPAARTVYKYSLGLSEADLKKPHCVVAALKGYYAASIGVSGERQKFLCLLQNENESIASWETRIRNQAAQCEYEDFADEIMRDQFIAGLTSDALRVKLIRKGHKHKDTAQTKVKLREVVEVAKTFEATMVANQLMKTAQDTQQDQVNTQQEQATINSPVKGTAQPLAKDVLRVGSLAISHVPVKVDQDVDKGDSSGKTKVVKAQIVLASTCNTIPSSLLSQLFPDVKIARTKSKINTYGTETIRPEGQVMLCCDRRGKIHTIDFLVVNVPNQKPPLLSGRDAQALDYLKVYADEINAVEEEIPCNTQSLPPLGKLTKEDVLHNYSNVFRPGRGNPLGTPLHIDLDPNVTPVHASTRRVPVAKLDRVNDELKRLCDEGIIKPVTQPTDWLSNILVKEKPNGKLRIRIDPSQRINKAIRRPKFTIPTIEEKL
ncbi:hypothetical protein ACROYT_G028361 [Oculina patagonica]